MFFTSSANVIDLHHKLAWGISTGEDGSCFNSLKATSADWDHTKRSIEGGEDIKGGSHRTVVPVEIGEPQQNGALVHLDAACTEPQEQHLEDIEVTLLRLDKHLVLWSLWRTYHTCWPCSCLVLKKIHAMSPRCTKTNLFSVSQNTSFTRVWKSAAAFSDHKAIPYIHSGLLWFDFTLLSEYFWNLSGFPRCILFHVQQHKYYKHIQTLQISGCSVINLIAPVYIHCSRSLPVLRHLAGPAVFDTVNYQILTTTLQELWVSCSALSLFTSHLKDRTYRVILQTEDQKTSSVSSA